MKNKAVKAVALLAAICMLGNSMVSAEEFSSGACAIAQEENMTEIFEDGDISDIDTFELQEGENLFSASEVSDEFSADESSDEIPQIEDPGNIDSALEARFKNAIIEAQLETDSSVKTTCKVYDSSNLECQDYSTFGVRVSSYLTTGSDGKIMRVQFGALEGKILVEYYDTSYNIESTVTVPLALPVFGAFYESSTSYYVLTGQDNPQRSDSTEVYRVTKYSKDWKVQGAASLFGENTTSPFSFGSARMIIDGNILYVRTCHVMYGGHQANVAFSVNIDTMEVADKLTEVSNSSRGYVSHSFNQFVQIDQGKMVALDQCDAFPARALVLLKYNTELNGGNFVPYYNNESCNQINIMEVDGETGDNYTGTSAGGFEYSDSCWLVAGNFDTDGANSSRNVFVAAVPKDGEDPTVRYFTDYAGTSDSASTPHLVKTGRNSFILLWSSQGKVYYTLVDGNGQQTGQIYSMTGNLSDCKPTAINGKLVWYTWNKQVNVFYEIDLSDLSNTHAIKIVNGHKVSYGKEVTNGTIAQFCTQCGEDLENIAVPISFEPMYKRNGIISPLDEDADLDIGNTYKIFCYPEFQVSGDRLEDCEVLSSDPSVISVNMLEATEAEITVHRAGTANLTIRSKYNPNAAMTVKISVGVLNQDEYTVKLSQYSFTYDGTEYKPTVTLYKDEYAVEKSNYTVTYEGDLVNVGTASAVVTGTGNLTGTLKRKFTITAADLYDCDITLSGDSFSETGKEIEPEVTAKFGEKLLQKDKDFTVEYTNNIKPGKAKVFICGKGNYEGEVERTFMIVKKSIANEDNTGNDTQSYKIEDCKIEIADANIIYDGKSKKPKVTVSHNEKTLKENQDYTVTYDNNKNAGMAKITVSGKGIYTGAVSKTFEIARANATIVASSKTVTMSSSKKQNIADTVITDGKVSYKTSDSKTVKISGNKFIALKPGKAVITISAKQGQNYNSLSNVKITITVRPTNTANLTVKSSNKGQIKVSWKAVKSISGYQIQYSTYANMKNAKKVTAKSKATSAAINKMTSKKNYYIRIRSYKTVNGKNYYSNWSTVKKVKVK